MKKILYLISIVITISLSSCNISNINSKLGSTKLGINVLNSNIEPSIHRSQYTNEVVDEQTLSKAAYFAVIENTNQARPQSGLSSADIVFEVPVEGGIPRFIALFQSKSPSQIGPIRSFRRIFSDIDQLVNLPVAHCGASDEAKQLIKSNELMSLNEFHNGSSYSRITTRPAPHNLYSTSDSITSLIKSKGYKYDQPLNLSFNDSYWDNKNLPICNSIILDFSKYYDTSYTFNSKTYTKHMNNDVAVDQNDSKPLVFKNIFIQKTHTALNPNGVLLDIDFYGSGEGILISNGKYVDVTWNITRNNNKFTLKDSEGNDVPFSTGNTIWEVVDNSSLITIN